MSTIVRQHHAWDSVSDYPVTEEDVCELCSRYPCSWYCSCQLRKPDWHEWNKLVTSFWSLKVAPKYLRPKIQENQPVEIIPVLLTIKFGRHPRAFCIIIEYCIDIAFHMSPIHSRLKDPYIRCSHGRLGSEGLWVSFNILLRKDVHTNS